MTETYKCQCGDCRQKVSWQEIRLWDESTEKDPYNRAWLCSKCYAERACAEANRNMR